MSEPAMAGASEQRHHPRRRLRSRRAADLGDPAVELEPVEIGVDDRAEDDVVAAHRHADAGDAGSGRRRPAAGVPEQGRAPAALRQRGDRLLEGGVPGLDP